LKTSKSLVFRTTKTPALPRAGEIMGRRREKKEGKRGEVGVVDYSTVEWMRPSIIW
jgi:hypothetical protein